jgi:hypothetical protein
VTVTTTTRRSGRKRNRDSFIHSFARGAVFQSSID